MIEIRPLRNDRDHARALKQIDEVWGARADSDEGRALEVLITLVDAYEREHHAIEAPDPVAAIRFRMEQLGLTRKELEPYLGSRGRVSEVLSGARPLTLAMIKKLREGLGISADVLVGAK